MSVVDNREENGIIYYLPDFPHFVPELVPVPREDLKSYTQLSAVQEFNTDREHYIVTIPSNFLRHREYLKSGRRDWEDPRAGDVLITKVFTSDDPSSVPETLGILFVLNSEKQVDGSVHWTLFVQKHVYERVQSQARSREQVEA